jgi:ketosteroid isomerase-like protein
MALYTQDAVFLQPTGERVTGLAAIRSLFVQVMGAVTSEPTLTSVDLDVSGDLAYDSGTYSETLTSVATGAKTSAKGSYLMVLKRGGDGQWRIQQQMWSQSP